MKDSCTSILARRASKPTKADLNEAKRVLHYLKEREGITSCILHEFHLECFVDADWVSEAHDETQDIFSCLVED
uniref:Uncharacterized protein n=1 Tax=Anopheles atroparvus TaxID=41427 RepID=A0AAG5CWS4_ANOAO